MSDSWILYGAYGYTGRMIAKACAERGLSPILAGRDPRRLAALSEETGLEYRAFDLSDVATISEKINGDRLVLHCAGPFSQTGLPMMQACLNTGVHYLDITGEIDVFRQAHELDEQAKSSSVMLLPGAGFDIVPTDCLAASLKQVLPDATHLAMGFEAQGGPSPGTAKTSIEGLKSGGRVRRNGELVSVPLAYKTRELNFGGGRKRTGVTIPWGDVYTSTISTGIPNVEVYLAVGSKTVANLRRMRRFQWLIASRPVQAFMKHRINRSIKGPSEDKVENTISRIWGEVSNGTHVKTARMETPNGYRLTMLAALGIVEHVLANDPPAGFHTPSMLMGAGYAASLPGVSMTLI